MEYTYRNGQRSRVHFAFAPRIMSGGEPLRLVERCVGVVQYACHELVAFERALVGAKRSIAFDAARDVGEDRRRQVEAGGSRRVCLAIASTSNCPIDRAEPSRLSRQNDLKPDRLVGRTAALRRWSSNSEPKLEPPAEQLDLARIARSRFRMASSRLRSRSIRWPQTVVDSPSSEWPVPDPVLLAFFLHTNARRWQK
jgi:hypothetical protein